MATIVHGNLTVADVVVIVCYILGAIAVGVWVRQILFLTYSCQFFILYLLKTPENQRFSVFFTKYKLEH